MKHIYYLGELEKKFIRHFDVERNFLYKDVEMDLFAKYSVRNEKYVGVKRASIYGFENNEYCFIKYSEGFDGEKLEGFVETLKEAVGDFVNPHSEHMSSMVTGVLVVDGVCDEELINKIKKFKFHKSFAFGFKGWVDIRLILVSLDKGEVITNKKGKEVKKIYQLE